MRGRLTVRRERAIITAYDVSLPVEVAKDGIGQRIE
jgi:hypothetical protein